MIKMWKTINYPMKKEDNNYIQTMDILENRSINWNDIKIKSKSNIQNH